MGNAKEREEITYFGHWKRNIVEDFPSPSKFSTLRSMFRYFFWTTLLFILCIGVFVFTITQLDPLGVQAIIALSLFFISLFGMLWTGFAYIFFFGAELTSGKNLMEKTFKQALRRGFFSAFFVSAMVALRLFNLLGWTEGILLAIFLLLLELIFSIDSEKILLK